MKIYGSIFSAYMYFVDIGNKRFKQPTDEVLKQASNDITKIIGLETIVHYSHTVQSIMFIIKDVDTNIVINAVMDNSERVEEVLLKLDYDLVYSAPNTFSKGQVDKGLIEKYNIKFATINPIHYAGKTEYKTKIVVLNKAVDKNIISMLVLKYGLVPFISNDNLYYT